MARMRAIPLRETAGSTLNRIRRPLGTAEAREGARRTGRSSRDGEGPLLSPILAILRLPAE